MTTATTTLTTFLLERIAEDEAVARAAGQTWAPAWKAKDCTAYGWRNGRLGNEPNLPFVVSDDENGSLMLASIWPEDGDSLTSHIARHDPARVLAECTAKRAIVEAHEGTHECVGAAPGGWLGVANDAEPCPTLRHLAAVYADRPHYLNKWRP